MERTEHGPTLRFNSIKVRLNQSEGVGKVHHVLFQFHKGTIKPIKLPLSSDASNPFQFHKGTIKPQDNTLQVTATEMFQFHKGTIKPAFRVTTSAPCNCFNSIKVRLNLCIGQHKQQIHMFQFHKGTIKPCSPCI